jgi:hypothetical protein
MNMGTLLKTFNVFHHPTIQGNAKAYVQHRIHQEMHEHSFFFKPCLPPLGDDFCGMG